MKEAGTAVVIDASSSAKLPASQTRSQADLFNAAFSITTNFANVQAIDDQGRLVCSSTSESDSVRSENGLWSSGNGFFSR